MLGKKSHTLQVFLKGYQEAFTNSKLNKCGNKKPTCEDQTSRSLAEIHVLTFDDILPTTREDITPTTSTCEGITPTTSTCEGITPATSTCEGITPATSTCDDITAIKPTCEDFTAKTLYLC